MLKYLVCLTLLVSSILFVMLPVWAAEGTKRPRSVLEGVAALDQPVTYTETKIPLGELVQKVSEDTGVRLTAAKDVADEPVAVVVRDFPARELLEQVADLLDYRWSRRGPSGRGQGSGVRGQGTNATTPTPNSQPPSPAFEIWQDLASKQREEALRQAALNEVVQRFREELKRYAEMAALSQAQIEAFREAAVQRAQMLGKLTPEERQAFLDRPEEKERSRRLNLLPWLWSPVARTMAQLLGRLTPQQWTRLLEDGKLVFATDPGAGELPLPADAARVFRSSRPSRLPPSMLSPSAPETEERERQREQAMQEQWGAATGYRVAVRLSGARFQPRGSLELLAQATPIRSGAPPGTPSFGMWMGTTLPVNAAPAELQQPREEDTPQRRAALANGPVVGAKQRFHPQAKPQIDPVIGAQGGMRVKRWDLLPELAGTYSVHFISDAYWTHAPSVSGTIAMSFFPADPVPLFTLLDAVSGRTHRWERAGKLIRLRSRTWFLDRPREVPLRLVRRWRTLLDRMGALPLEEYFEMVGTLSDGQLATLSDIFEDSGTREDFYFANTARHALRLYASLMPTQREALLSGRPIPVAQLTARQRELFAAAVREPHRLDFTLPNLEQLAGGSFRVSAQRFVRIREERGGAVRFRLERQTARDPGLGPRREGAPAPAEASRPVEPRGPVAATDRVVAYPVARLEFHLDYGPQMREQLLLHIASPR